MDYPKSVPNIGLVGGKFVDENQLTGTPGSLIPSVWGNSVTDEVLNVIAASGQAPSEADLTQLVKAIRSLIQANATNYAADTGTANVYAAAFTPAITALTDGTVVRVKIKTANSGASTFNPNGLGAKPIVGSAHAALQGGELVANGHAWLQYNSSLSGGSWVILASSGGAQQVARGVSSGQAVNQSQLGSLSGVKRILNASTTLAAADVGALISVEGAAGSTQTLMPIAGVPTGATITFTASTSVTISPSGSETISVPEAGNVSAIQMTRGDTVTLTRDVTRWWVSSYYKAAAGPLIGSAVNAKMSVMAPSATAIFSADEVCVKGALGGSSATIGAFSATLNLGGVGAGGMDTGVAPASGFVGLYAIYNPVTGASALLAVNATNALLPNVYGGANMPAGYTASALVSVWPTTASGQFAVGIQVGREISIATNNVLTTSTAQASLTAFSVAAAIPRNAVAFRGEYTVSSTIAGAGVSGVISGSPLEIGRIAIGLTCPTPGAAGTTSFPLIAVLNAQTIYYRAAVSSGVLAFSVIITGYTF